jgi:hypothetical protein
VESVSQFNLMILLVVTSDSSLYFTTTGSGFKSYKLNNLSPFSTLIYIGQPTTPFEPPSVSAFDLFSLDNDTLPPCLYIYSAYREQLTWTSLEEDVVINICGKPRIMTATTLKSDPELLVRIFAEDEPFLMKPELHSVIPIGLYFTVPHGFPWSPHGVLKSSWSPRGVFMESSWSPCRVLMESSWSPHRVLVESSWSLHGVFTESSWSPWIP